MGIQSESVLTVFIGTMSKLTSYKEKISAQNIPLVFMIGCSMVSKRMTLSYLLFDTKCYGLENLPKLSKIVCFELTSIQSYIHLADQAVSNQVNNGSRIQENFQNLFDSMVKNNEKQSEIYHGILKQETMRKQQAFDAMKEQLQIVQNKNARKSRNLYQKNDIDDYVVAKKREANNIDNVKTDDYNTALPITSPEEAYLDCLKEAKYQIDEQRFHICSVNKSYQILIKIGMKMPEFDRLLNVIEDFYNFTSVLIGQKLRGEEEFEDKYDPVYKAAFLTLSHTWRNLVAELDKQAPKYQTETRLKKMKEEMYIASNSSYKTYFLLSDLQTGMATTKKPQKTYSTTTTESISIRIAQS